MIECDRYKNVFVADAIPERKLQTDDSLKKTTLHIIIVNNAMTHLENTLSYGLFNHSQYNRLRLHSRAGLIMME